MYITVKMILLPSQQQCVRLSGQHVCNDMFQSMCSAYGLLSVQPGVGVSACFLLQCYYLFTEAMCLQVHFVCTGAFCLQGTAACIAWQLALLAASLLNNQVRQHSRNRGHTVGQCCTLLIAVPSSLLFVAAWFAGLAAKQQPYSAAYNHHTNTWRCSNRRPMPALLQALYLVALGCTLLLGLVSMQDCSSTASAGG
jgi:hypothetical protein